MKKLLAVILAFCAVFSLCACKSKNSDGQKSVTTADTSTRSYEDVRLHSVADEIATGLFTGNLKDFTEEEKKMIESYLSEMDFKIKFQSDGSAILSRENDVWTVGKGWVKNSYTKDVPEQTLGTVTMSMENKSDGQPSFIFMIKSNSDKDAFEKYKQTLIDAGFKSIGGAVYEGDEVFEGIKDNKKHIRISLSGKGYVFKITELTNSNSK